MGTPDLFEARNIPQVVLCLYSLGRVTQKHPEYTGPAIGPKMAEKNERNFTEEQIRQGRDATIGLQSGSNAGASQAGHGGMGNTRHMWARLPLAAGSSDKINAALFFHKHHL